MTYYIKLEDVLKLLPKDDLVGPKPSRLRREVNELTKYVDKEEEKECIMDM